MTIENIKNELMAAQAALNQCRAEGLKETTVEGMTNAAAKLEGCKAKVALLQDQLSQLEDESMKKTEIVDNDKIKSAASKFANLGDFLNAVHGGVRSDDRLANYIGIRNASGQNITTDSDGGYLVPPDYADELLVMAKSQSVLFPEVRKTTVSGNRLVENYLTQTKRTDTSTDSGTTTYGRTGLIAYWKAEAAQLVSSKMNISQRTTSLSKLTGLAYATDEMLEDYVAMSSLIAESFRDEFAFQIDNAILNGRGMTTYNEPIGMLTSANTALVTIAKETSQAAATINMNNILKMYNALPADMRTKARWYINQDVELALIQMTMQTGTFESGSFGVPVYMPANGLSDNPFGRLLGIPVVPVEQCSALGTVGDIALLVPEQYRWIEKGGLKAATSIHVKFDYEETAFRFTYRCNGRPMWANAITAYKGSTSRSPYVALATRA